MKKTLLITLLLIPFLGIAQTTKPIDGFLGIKFGSNKATVLAAIKAKGGILDRKVTKANLLFFTNVKLGHRASGSFFVRFINDKAYEADFFFDAEMEAKVIEYYDGLVADLSEIYGKGEPVKEFKEPYAAGDGFETQGIKLGKVTYETTWQGENKNVIQATISTDLTIDLVYQDDVLSTLAEKAEKSKEKGDY